MRRVLKVWLCTGVFAGLAACSFADTKPPRDFYESILQRNVFDLKPPAPPVQQEAAPAPAMNVVLSGITTILGNKVALLQLPARAGRPGEPLRDEGFILTEGQREGLIEVIQIDERKGAVRILAAGAPMTLTFENNGPKLPSAAGGAAPGTPRIPSLPGPATARPFPGYTPNTNNALTPTGYPMGRRGYNSTAGGLSTNAGSYGASALNTNALGAGLAPAPPLPGSTGAAVPPAVAQPGVALSPAEQAVLTEVQRELERERAASSRQPANPPPPVRTLTAPGPYLPGGQAPPYSVLPGRETVPPQ